MNILEYENTQEIKTHGLADFPFNIYLCSIPLDFPLVPTHWHNDMEIIYVKKGTGRISVDLEPFTVNQGDIIGDITKRRGQIAELTPENGSTKIVANVPLSELFGYATAIRSLSKGRASYVMEPSYFERVPAQVQEKIVEKCKK